MNVRTNGSSAYAFRIYDANNNFTIRDSILNSSYAGIQELLVNSAVTSGEWNFTNVTRADGSRINTSWTAGGNGTLNMMWYLDVNVSVLGSPNVNVSAWDVNNNSVFSTNLTGSGSIAKQTLWEYTNVNNTLITYYTPHTVNTTAVGYNTNSTSVNISSSLNTVLNINLSDTSIPTITINNPVNATNLNNLSQIVNITSSGANSMFYNNGLVSWWRMDDTNGSSNSVVDYLGRNNGTAVGNATQTSAGKMGKGESFDGDGDIIDLGNNIDLGTSDYTFSAWIKISQKPASAASILAQHWSYPITNLQIDSNGKVVSRIGYNLTFNVQTTYSDGSDLSDNNWHLLIVTFDRDANMTKYIDGVSVQGSNISSNNGYNMSGGTTTDHFLIGSSNTVASPMYEFNGTIDDVMIFNRSLSADEIVALYNATAIYHTDTFSEGNNSITAYSQDFAGNIGTASSTFTIDTSIPTLNVTSPVNTSTYNSSSVLFNVSSSEEGTGSIVPDIDNSLVSWWRMDDTNGSCYDNETRVMTSEGWKYFKDVNMNDDKILSLNGTSGEIHYENIIENKVFDNSNLSGEMYKTSGGELVVSEKHKIYGRFETSNLSSYNIINLPSKSSELNFSLSNEENALINACRLSCGILNQTTENICSLGYKDPSVKSQSLVTNILFSNFENSANSPFESPFGFEIMSNPCCLRNVSNLFFTFSSLRNLIEGDAELDIISTPHQACCILQCCFNILFSDSRIIFEDFINAHPSFEHFQDLPDHDSCAFECGLSMTDFAVCNNIFVNFNSHCKDSNNNEIFKLFYNKNLSDFKLQKISDIYSEIENNKIKASDLVFLDENGNEIEVESIEKVPYTGEIYDVDVLSDIILVERNGLVVWSGNSNSVVDYTGRNNGTAINATRTDAGKMGKGYSFDGNGDYINAGSITLGNKFTISLWINTNTNVTGWRHAFAGPSNGEPGYGMTGSRMRLTKLNIEDGPVSNTFLQINRWYHLAVTFDDTNNMTTYYVNGANDGGGQFNQTFVDGVRWIGASTSFYFNGSLDDVMIFNRSLSAEEILSIYNATKYQHTQNISDGSHTFKAYTQDLAGNIGGSSLLGFSVDTIFPLVNFTSPTPSNASTQSNTDIYVNVTANDSASNVSAFIDFDNSLVSWWRMDDTNQSVGTYGAKVYDYTGRNNGTAYRNASQTDAGKLGKGFSFDGAVDYINITSGQVIGNTDTTICAWIKPIGWGGGTFGRIVDNEKTDFFVTSTNSRLWFESDGSTPTYSGINSISLNIWQFVCVQRNSSGSANFYVNGIDSGSANQSSGTPASGTTDLYIGNRQAAPDRSFNGTIDDVMIFNRSLSAEEIAGLYANTSSKYLSVNYTSLADGTHTFRAYTQDLGGNVNYTEMRSVTLDTTPLSITLFSPLNNSGDNDGNVSFTYAVDDINNITNCSLIIDSEINETNTSIVENINSSFDLQLSAGSYNWSISCTDSVGNVNASETRIIIVVKTNEEFSGGTTDLSNVDMGSITNLVLDSPNYGKISFSESVDLSEGADIDAYVNLSFNRIEINSSELSELNKSAKLYLYNLTFTTPRLLREGAICPSSICTKESYSSGILSFNVTQFSVYSSEETPTIPVTTPPGGGGGGSYSTENFSVDINSIKVIIALNETQEKEIKIKNIGEKNITVKLAAEGENFDKIIVFENSSIKLEPGEEKIIKFNIVAPKEPGVYAGKIIFKSLYTSREVLASINVQSKETSFDVSVAVPELVAKGSKINAQISLIPVGEKGIDATLKYLIKDFGGKVYYETSNTVYVDKNISFVKEFSTDELESGDYVLGLEVTYEGGLASASSHFKIERSEKLLNPAGNNFKGYYLVIFALLILLVVVLLLWKIARYKKIKK
jgi:hypothetical protein